MILITNIDYIPSEALRRRTENVIITKALEKPKVDLLAILYKSSLSN